ncbi:MAG TPA: GEVED domain-containing protein [Flavobacteriales bacterium]
MMLRTTLVLLAAVVGLSAFAQLQPRPLHTGHDCGTDVLHQQRMAQDPAYRAEMRRFSELAQRSTGRARSLTTYKIPVVVHVLETGTALTDITDAEIVEAIQAMNERFRRVVGTPGANGVEVGMEFVLAVRDPNGNCTNGITRRNMTGNTLYMASGVGGAGLTDAQVKAIDRWDPTTYYNVWLVGAIDGVAGYATLAPAHGSAVDGIVQEVSEARPSGASIWTHEMGHAMNLFHTFEGDANGTACPVNTACAMDGDQLCDTPPHIRSSIFTCTSGGTNSCDGGSANALFENNYMDYSGCTDRFTTQQAARMMLAFETYRGSFLTANGNLALVPPGVPVLSIRTPRKVVCGAGQSITLYATGSCLPNTWLPDSEFPGISFAWTVTNGVNTYTSTAQNPTFTLASAGTYNATLSVTTTAGTAAHTANGVVVVTGAAPAAACVPTTTYGPGWTGQNVQAVRFRDMDHTTGFLYSDGYSDLACTRSTVVARNGTYPLTVLFSAGQPNEGGASVEVYIDYNNNGSFEPGELVGSGTGPVNERHNRFTTTVTIPNTAVQNTLLRMRVYSEWGPLSAAKRSCTEPFLIADVEDYGVYVSGAMASVSIAASPSSTITYGTNVTFTPTPVNGGGAPTYQWFRNDLLVGTGATYSNSTLLPGDRIHARLFSNLVGVVASPATSNTLTMTVTGPPRTDFTASAHYLCTGNTISFTDASLLTPTAWSWSFVGGTPSTSTAQHPTITYNTPGTYAVTLTASNGLGTGTGTTVTRTAYITVFSAAPAMGCTVTRTTAPAGDVGITSFRLGAFERASAYDGPVMEDLTCSHIIALDGNTTYPIAVEGSGFNPQWRRVYIDYNRDGDFGDAGEEVFAPAQGQGRVAGTFTTPASPLIGQPLRLRVITDFVNTVPGACTTLQYGQVEEYGVVFNPGVLVSAKVLLQGPYNSTTGLMNDALRTLPGFPAAQPYAPLRGYAGTETVAPAVLSVTGGNAVVDWVLVQLRSSTAPGTIVSQAAGLLQRDGDIVAVDGTSPLAIPIGPGNYHVAVMHRNHLGAMTAGPVALARTTTALDLGQAATATYGTDARCTIGAVRALWAGDVRSDGVLRYTGTNNDRDPILVAIGGLVPTNTLTGYRSEDVNLDGTVRYTGSANDRDIILQNIGGVVPTSTRVEQVP